MELFPMNLWPDSFEETRGEWGAITAYGVGKVRETLERQNAPVFSCRMTYATTREDIAQLDAFLEARRGEAEAFWFYSFDLARSHRALACGSGDGATAHFAAPLSSPDEAWLQAVCKVAGVAKVRGTDWELGYENRVPYSEDLSQTGTWLAVSGATVTRTGGQAAPTGPATAWRIQTSGGTITSKLGLNFSGLPTAGILRFSTWIKVEGTKAVGVVVDGTLQTFAPGGGWVECVSSRALNAPGTAYPRFYAPAVGDALDFHLWHPKLQVTTAVLGDPTSAWSYLPTGAAARVADSLGRAFVGFYAPAVPTAGQLITLDAVGRRLHTVHFTRDSGQVVRLSGEDPAFGVDVAVREVAS